MSRVHRAVRGAAQAGLSAYVVVTALSQHPSRVFDRFRPLDRTGVLIPNWRFFAPEPAMHDFRVLYRVRHQDSSVSDWREVTSLAPRKARQALWFPDRRRDKAVIDICNEMIGHLADHGQRTTELPSYRLLRAHIAGALQRAPRAATDARTAVSGFQFVVARAGGYDEAIEPQYLFASPYELLATSP